MATENAVMAVIRASRPSFKNPHDKLAYALHASFLAAGYVLTATGKQAFSDPPPSLSGQEEVGIEGWNEMDDSYGFIYYKFENGCRKSVSVKCLPIGDTLVIEVLPLDEKLKEPLNLQINVNDYVRENTASNNYGELYKDLHRLVEGINSEILSKLESMPKKDKASSSSRSEADVGLAHSQNQPDAGLPPENQPYSSGLIEPPFVPFGFDDTLPGPAAGIYPNRVGSGIGGTHLGPNDPFWHIRIGEQPEFPISGVPPGARFDPYGPPDIPGFEPNRFASYFATSTTFHKSFLPFHPKTKSFNRKM